VTDTSPSSDTQRTRPGAIGFALAVLLVGSATATAFLFWLIYMHSPTGTDSARGSFLPALNALFNSLSATALLLGYARIRTRRIAAHHACMIAAFAFSTLFLVSYILYHAQHGDVRYPVHAALRHLYLPLLASHILVATITLPLVLVTFFFSLTGRISLHRKVARWTFPLWLYVSITGVAVYVMLRLAQG
jgi:putative membrane protein